MVKFVHRPSEKVFCKTWWHSTFIPVRKSTVRHVEIRPLSQWVSQSSVRHGEIRSSSLWVSSVRHGDIRTMIESHHVLQKTYSLRRWKNVTMSYRRLTHWDDGRMSPCLTEALLTGTIDEYHHVLQRTLTGTMDEFHHDLQKTDLLTGKMDEFHHVLQKTFSLGWWSNVTMSYRRLTEVFCKSLWNSSIVPVRLFCKTWWYSSIVPVSKSSVRHGDIRPSSQWESLL
jgi:hypothetical protein